MQPHLLFVGRNGVCTDTICAAAMGYDPAAGHKEFPFMGDSQQQYPSRFPNNRHPDKTMNILYVDGHGKPSKPTEFSSDNFRNMELPSAYAPPVRVSPYEPYASDR